MASLAAEAEVNGAGEVEAGAEAGEDSVLKDATVKSLKGATAEHDLPPRSTLLPTQLMLEMLFTKFDCDADGVLNFEEFAALDAATEDEPQQLDKDTWAQLLQIVGASSTGTMDLDDFSMLYVDQEHGGLAEMLGTDLNSDFACVFPSEAKVCMIFEAYDSDRDGFLSYTEFKELLEARPNVTDNDILDEASFVDLLCEGNQHLSLSTLFELYLYGKEEKSEPGLGEGDEASTTLSLLNLFRPENVDVDAEIAAAKIGLSEASTT
eukprot:g4084.t1